MTEKCGLFTTFHAKALPYLVLPVLSAMLDATSWGLGYSYPVPFLFQQAARYSLVPLFQSESKRETILMSRGAFCLRMLRREHFDVSNRWYAPTLRGRKSQNGGGCNKVFGGVSLRNLCKRVTKSTKWFRGVS